MENSKVTVKGITKSIFRMSLLVGGGALLSGCATLFVGPTQKVFVSTNNGERVLAKINNVPIMIPAQVNINKGVKTKIVVSDTDNPCFKTVEETIFDSQDRQIHFAFFANFISGGLPGSTTDAATGSMWVLDPNYIVNLEEKENCSPTKNTWRHLNVNNIEQVQSKQPRQSDSQQYQPQSQKQPMQNQQPSYYPPNQPYNEQYYPQQQIRQQSNQHIQSYEQRPSHSQQYQPQSQSIQPSQNQPMQNQQPSYYPPNQPYQPYNEQRQYYPQPEQQRQQPEQYQPRQQPQYYPQSEQYQPRQQPSYHPQRPYQQRQTQQRPYYYNTQPY